MDPTPGVLALSGEDFGHQLRADGFAALTDGETHALFDTDRLAEVETDLRLAERNQMIGERPHSPQRAA